CAAITQMSFGSINKVALVFSEVFWDVSIRQMGWASNIRGQYTQIILLHPKPVIIVLLSSHFSTESEERPKIELINESMAVVTLLTKRVLPPLVSAFVSRWRSDPYSRGTYSFLSSGMLARDYDILSYPVEDRLLFAGEHTMRLYPSTVHGAFISGKREGDRIIDWVTGKLEKEKVYKWFCGPEDAWYSVDLTCIVCQDFYEEDVMVGPSEADRMGWFTFIKCAFCGQSQTLERPFSGCVLFEDNFNQKRTWAVHADCCYHCPEVGSNEEGSRWYNVSKALRRGANILCAICNFPGATIGCSLSSCNNEMHLPCANDVLRWPNYENSVNEPLLCPIHTKASKNDPSQTLKGMQHSPKSTVPQYRAISEEDYEWNALQFHSSQLQESNAASPKIIEKEAMQHLPQSSLSSVDSEHFDSNERKIFREEVDQFRPALIPLIKYCCYRWKRRHSCIPSAKSFNYTPTNAESIEISQKHYCYTDTFATEYLSSKKKGNNATHPVASNNTGDAVVSKQFIPELCASARLQSTIYGLLHQCKN
ncbi:histone lysine-specific demethylase LSD1/BHC110/KDMA1A, partial [Cardiosporidium cionae]